MTAQPKYSFREYWKVICPTSTKVFIYRIEKNARKRVLALNAGKRGRNRFFAIRCSVVTES